MNAYDLEIKVASSLHEKSLRKAVLYVRVV